ncbi:hypothetical protein LUZ60_007985 [Juncus effusus]|nr:hypothetical protein LUZ60_007985 [Juncus effusus]
MARFLGISSGLLLLIASAFVAETVEGTSTLNFRPMGGEGSVKKEDCPAACEYRCSATSHKKPCMFFCQMCCEKCLCLPSGTSGNKEECPCYNNWKTKEGSPKCPSTI